MQLVLPNDAVVCPLLQQRTEWTGSGTGSTVDLQSEMSGGSKAGSAAGSVGISGQTSGHLLKMKLGGRGGRGRPAEHRRQPKLENLHRSAAPTPLETDLKFKVVKRLKFALNRDC